MDWGKHRRQKTAAKMHLRLDLHSFRPSFAVVDTAGQHNNKRSREVCGGIAAGEIVVIDHANVDFDHLADPESRSVWWLTRAKNNISCHAVKNLTEENETARDPLLMEEADRFFLSLGLRVSGPLHAPPETDSMPHSDFNLIGAAPQDPTLFPENRARSVLILLKKSRWASAITFGAFKTATFSRPRSPIFLHNAGLANR